MNSFQIAANKTFQAFAMAEAFDLISKKTGIKIENLHKQFAEGNKDLIESVAKMVALAAETVAETLNEGNK
jgi:hypothetical protein